MPFKMPEGAFVDQQIATAMGRFEPLGACAIVERLMSNLGLDTLGRAPCEDIADAMRMSNAKKVKQLVMQVLSDHKRTCDNP